MFVPCQSANLLVLHEQLKILVHGMFVNQQCSIFRWSWNCSQTTALVAPPTWYPTQTQHLKRSPVLSHRDHGQVSGFFSCAIFTLKYQPVVEICEDLEMSPKHPCKSIRSAPYQIDKAPHQKVSGPQHGAIRLAMPSKRKSEACEEPLNISGHRNQKPKPVVIAFEMPLTRWFKAKD